MLKVLSHQQTEGPALVHKKWLEAFWSDFRRRFVSLLGFQFRKMSPALALAILHNKAVKETHMSIKLKIWQLVSIKLIEIRTRFIKTRTRDSHEPVRSQAT